MNLKTDTEISKKKFYGKFKFPFISSCRLSYGKGVNSREDIKSSYMKLKVNQCFQQMHDRADYAAGPHIFKIKVKKKKNIGISIV